MPKITEEVAYNGFDKKVQRLGLSGLVEEVRQALTSFTLSLEERKNANGGAVVREKVDEALEAIGGWNKKVSGDVDWMKSKAAGGITVQIGVDVQISGRNGRLAVDIIRLRRKIKDGLLDAGIVVVPNEAIGAYLRDGTPTIADAKKHMTEADFGDEPIMLVAFEHDGAGATPSTSVTANAQNLAGKGYERRVVA